jgi:hypothetical protein
MDEEKIEKNKRKLFDRLRKLNKKTSEENLKELEDLFRYKSRGEGKLSAEFCITELEITMEQLTEVYNDISDQINCPIKYVKENKIRK